ncbi:myb DNA-binding like domain-containing protein [Phthorimaea operculella]|nr:myb DNA-binding like domain-containing protein [Phthorimaea operculella]
MSTRRARIKAVAALPPRRKNQENADAKNKLKEGFEQSAKSPRTPRGKTSKAEDKSSPSKNVLRSPPPLLPISSLSKTPIPDKVPSPAKIGSPKLAEKPASSPKPEKVPVITPTPSIKSVFASPHVRNSPDRRRTASPLVLPSPKPATSSDSTTPQATKDKNEVEKSVNEILSKKLEKIASDRSSIASNISKCLSTGQEKKSNVPDDYTNVPSVLESVTEETVMDGIVPLQTAKNAPKPIDMLKNEIISDYAEVLFDPIVPLPSPSKVRPKLRPVPRLAPHRRNSIQGSASESEDESRRALLSGAAATPAPPAPPARQRHDSQTTTSSSVVSAPLRDAKRMRNDSISSSVSQAAPQPSQPPPATSPVKEKHFSNKTRRQEMSKRSWCRKREMKRDALTMYDLIFYNPTTNPIVPDEDELNAKEANAKEEAERSTKVQENEENADDPPASDAAPVPQIKLGPNGEIILDEQSLVIKQSDTRKVSSVVREGSWAGSGGGKYTRSARTAEWTPAETVRFYRALAAVGTDFTLMAPLFPDRKRKDLYLKFKKEERANGAQVDKALTAATAWDPLALEEEFKQERAEAARLAEEERARLQKKREEERARMKACKHRTKRVEAARLAEEERVRLQKKREEERARMKACKHRTSECLLLLYLVQTRESRSSQAGGGRESQAAEEEGGGTSQDEGL